MMRKAYTFMFPILILTVLTAGLVFQASALKGSYPGINGKIAFEDEDKNPPYDREIFVMDDDGTNIEQLTFNDLTDFSPCWSPDGTKIVFARTDTNPTEDTQIWTMNADGSDKKQLTSDGSVYGDPAWSPDGKKIAFVRDFDIYVIDVDGPVGVGTLLIHDGTGPSWSPDGTKIVYNNPFGTWLMVADANTGSDVTPWTDIHGLSPCWSPDGTKIVFAHNSEIWVMDAADGSNRNQLSNPSSDLEDDEPNWSPDGEKIVFHREEDSIWIMNADGTNEFDLTPSLPDARDPDYQRLVELPPVGGVVSPINKFELLTPYLALAGLIMAISTVYVIKKSKN
jgi:Tol biopolymer transport system component